MVWRRKITFDRVNLLKRGVIMELRAVVKSDRLDALAVLGQGSALAARASRIEPFRVFCPRVLPTMEINPILNSIKDLSERSQTIRGYL